MDIVYATKNEWMDQTFSFAGAKGTCDSNAIIKCGTTNAIQFNSKEECDRYNKDSCEPFGCGQFFGAECKKKFSNKLSQLSEKVKRDLNGTDFKDKLSKYTGFDIKETGAMLNATSLKSLAICTAARSNYTEFGDPSLITCDDYKNATCKINDYTYAGPNEGFCHNSTDGSSTYYPTWSPTGDHSVTPTYSPTYTPTGSVCYYTGDQRDNS
jgi:hypothetical protein